MFSDFRVRKANRKKAEFLRQNGQTTEANKALAGAIEIDYNLTLKFIKVSFVPFITWVFQTYLTLTSSRNNALIFNELSSYVAKSPCSML